MSELAKFCLVASSAIFVCLYVWMEIRSDYMAARKDKEAARRYRKSAREYSSAGRRWWQVATADLKDANTESKRIMSIVNLLPGYSDGDKEATRELLRIAFEAVEEEDRRARKPRKERPS